MLKDNIEIYQSDINDNCIKIKEVSLNELLIILPLEGFTIKVSTPLFYIEGISPAEITLIVITCNKFLIKIVTSEFCLVTIVPSLLLEVFNPEGGRIIKIVAPPK